MAMVRDILRFGRVKAAADVRGSEPQVNANLWWGHPDVGPMVGDGRIHSGIGLVTGIHAGWLKETLGYEVENEVRCYPGGYGAIWGTDWGMREDWWERRGADMVAARRMRALAMEEGVRSRPGNFTEEILYWQPVHVRWWHRSGDEHGGFAVGALMHHEHPEAMVCVYSQSKERITITSGAPVGGQTWAMSHDSMREGIGAADSFARTWYDSQRRVVLFVGLPEKLWEAWYGVTRRGLWAVTLLPGVSGVFCPACWNGTWTHWCGPHVNGGEPVDGATWETVAEEVVSKWQMLGNFDLGAPDATVIYLEGLMPRYAEWLAGQVEGAGTGRGGVVEVAKRWGCLSISGWSPRLSIWQPVVLREERKWGSGWKALRDDKGDRVVDTLLVCPSGCRTREFVGALGEMYVSRDVLLKVRPALQRIGYGAWGEEGVKRGWLAPRPPYGVSRVRPDVWVGLGVERMAVSHDGDIEGGVTVVEDVGPGWCNIGQWDDGPELQEREMLALEDWVEESTPGLAGAPGASGLEEVVMPRHGGWASEAVMESFVGIEGRVIRALIEAGGLECEIEPGETE